LKFLNLNRTFEQLLNHQKIKWTISIVTIMKNQNIFFAIIDNLERWILIISYAKWMYCYVLVSNTNTSHLVIASLFSDQASLLDNLSQSSINQTYRFNDFVQTFNERIMKWTRDFSTKVLLNNSRRISSRDIHLTTWKRLRYESSSTSKLFISLIVKYK
jgi:hypothetical protein